MIPNRPDGNPSRTDGSPDERGDVRSVEVEGRSRIVVSETDGLPHETRTCTVECASGERATATWTGVPIATLVELADFPGDTTHLHAEAEDFTAQVPIRAAMDGIVAFDRTGGDRAGLPRLIAEGVPGERLVKRVRRLSPIELAPEDDPRVG